MKRCSARLYVLPHVCVCVCVRACMCAFVCVRSSTIYTHVVDTDYARFLFVLFLFCLPHLDLYRAIN